MAASGGVTYDGVPSAQGGNIFKGVTFWVSHKVPQRPTIVKNITASFTRGPCSEHETLTPRRAMEASSSTWRRMQTCS